MLKTRTQRAYPRLVDLPCKPPARHLSKTCGNLLIPGALLQGRKGGMYSKARQPQTPLILWSYEVGCWFAACLVSGMMSGMMPEVKRCGTLHKGC